MLEYFLGTLFLRRPYRSNGTKILQGTALAGGNPYEVTRNRAGFFKKNSLPKNDLKRAKYMLFEIK